MVPSVIPGMIQSMVMMRELPGARSVAFWVIGLYGFTTAPRWIGSKLRGKRDRSRTKNGECQHMEKMVVYGDQRWKHGDLTNFYMVI